eukprot:376688-Amphidinium_carterae.1
MRGGRSALPLTYMGANSIVAGECTHLQTLREQYLANTVGEKAANRALFREIVDMNKERLQRSNDTARELTLAKIQVGNAKLDAEKEQRNKALKYHAEVCRAITWMQYESASCVLQPLLTGFEGDAHPQGIGWRVVACGPAVSA